MKKLFYGLVAVLVLLCAAAGMAWLIKGEQWRAEYAAYRKTGAPVLMYHAVGNEKGPDWPRSLIMPPALFEEHLRYLKQQGYTIVSVEELVHRLENGDCVVKFVAVRFDEG